MTVTIERTGLLNALRLSNDGPVAIEMDRLLGYATEYCERLAPDAPDISHNQAIVQFVGYLFHRPFADPGNYARAYRNSGADEILAPFRVAGVAAARIPGGVGSLDTVGVQTLIDAHAVMPHIHHTPPMGQALIDAHAAITAAHHEPGEGGTAGILDVINGRLPAPPVQMRLAWKDANEPVTAASFGAGSADGMSDFLLSPDFPQAWLDAGVSSAFFIFWCATDSDPASFPFDPDEVDYVGTDLTVDGVAGQYWLTLSARSQYISGIPFTVLFPGELVATRPWVETQIANIMISGGGITIAQAQALIDAAIGDFPTNAEVTAFVNSAIAGLPDYQTLAEVTALINNAVTALSMGQTSAMVQAMIAMHAGMPNAHHIPPAGSGGANGWEQTVISISADLADYIDTGIVIPANAALAIGLSSSTDTEEMYTTWIDDTQTWTAIMDTLGNFRLRRGTDGNLQIASSGDNAALYVTVVIL